MAETIRNGDENQISQGQPTGSSQESSGLRQPGYSQDKDSEAAPRDYEGLFTEELEVAVNDLFGRKYKVVAESGDRQFIPTTFPKQEREQ